jgi:hypothetical protein
VSHEFFFVSRKHRKNKWIFALEVGKWPIASPSRGFNIVAIPRADQDSQDFPADCGIVKQQPSGGSKFQKDRSRNVLIAMFP